MANEKRLIDANALSVQVMDASYWDNQDEDVIWNLVQDAPTVDAVEVVHGRCEYCKDGKSFIGARLILGNDGEWHKINHCPNCGAKMDGDGNG